MIVRGIFCCRKYPIQLHLLRFGKQFACEYSNTARTGNPVKYSLNKASKVTIGENLEYTQKLQEENSWIKRYVYLGCICAILIYFGILREENDLDEIIKGNPVRHNDEVELVNLQIKLIYCEKNNLPTTKLKEKIEEYRERIRQKNEDKSKIKY